MPFWSRLFGPSTTDKLLDVLREDRAAQTALLTSLIDATRAQSALAQQQLDLLKAPPEPPIVRVMDDAAEAAYERKRRQAKIGSEIPEGSQVIDPDALMAALAAEFRAEAQRG